MLRAVDITLAKDVGMRLKRTHIMLIELLNMQDFESERKWKLAQAKKVAIRASKGMLDQATREEKKMKVLPFCLELPFFVVIFLFFEEGVVYLLVYDKEHHSEHWWLTMFNLMSGRGTKIEKSCS